MPNGHEPPLVHAPYNFVPLSARVLEVEWADRISHDVPFEDGICGHLEVELVAETPLCVGGVERQDNEIRPFRTLDGELAIPGSSIKGMLRNVVEIATFSKMQLVDRKRRFAVRDLNNPELYRSKMTETIGEKNGRAIYASKARPGWLRRKDEGWTIEPCDVARVEQQDLLNLVAGRGAGLRSDLEACFTCAAPGASKVSTREKYAVWDSTGLSRGLSFDLDSKTVHPMSNNSDFLSFRLATNLSGGTQTGSLVLTGQPSANQRLLRPPKNKGKHREFLFYGGAGQELAVKPEVQRNFELNHSVEQAQRHGGQFQPNDEWGFWRDQLVSRAVARVPVFFLTGPEGVTSFGLTQMYRLAYEFSVGDLIDHTSKAHRPDPLEGEKVSDVVRWVPPVDFAEALFGYVRSAQSGGEGMGGRVEVGLFRCCPENQIEPEGEEKHHAVLSSPKPTYYPVYVDQTPSLDTSKAKLRTGRYLTYMDGEAEIRGWKRYPARTETHVPEGEAPENVMVHWRTVPAGTAFTGKIRVHNLRPAELGALLWALDFGGSTDSFHSLGLAKPLGFGQVQLRLRSSQDLRNLKDKTKVDLAAARRRFKEHIDQAIPSWSETEQVVQLLAMADPQTAKEHDLSYMRLGENRAANEFDNAKKSYHALPAYAFFGGKTDRERYPRHQEQQRWQDCIQDLEKEARLRRAEAEERSEKERRQALGPAGRLREDHSGLLGLALEDQVEALLALRRQAPEEESDPAVWAEAVQGVFAEAIEIMRRDAKKVGGGRLETVERELTQHLESKPEDKRSRQYKRWTRKRDDLTTQLEVARRELEAASSRGEELASFLDWLDDLAAGSARRAITHKP